MQRDEAGGPGQGVLWTTVKWLYFTLELLENSWESFVQGSDMTEQITKISLVCSQLDRKCKKDTGRQVRGHHSLQERLWGLLYLNCYGCQTGCFPHSFPTRSDLVFSPSYPPSIFSLPSFLFPPLSLPLFFIFPYSGLSSLFLYTLLKILQAKVTNYLTPKWQSLDRIDPLSLGILYGRFFRDTASPLVSLLTC